MRRLFSQAGSIVLTGVFGGGGLQPVDLRQPPPQEGGGACELHSRYPSAGLGVLGQCTGDVAAGPSPAEVQPI
ncbi:hypothetical protein BDB13_3934 [Rhodococcus sp. OK302]|nr:hypothetical protein BDB13_3934 [Rhodococcus sp. OK302]